MHFLQASLRAKPNYSLLAILLGGVGIGISGILGILVGVQAFQHPINPSSFDRTWALFYIALLAIVAGLCWFGRGRWLIIITLVAVGGLVLATVVRAGTGPAFLTLLWLAAVGTALGYSLLKVVAPTTQSGGPGQLVLAGSIGLGCLALLMLAIGSFGLFYPAVAYGLLIGLTLLLLPAMVRASRWVFSIWVPRLRNTWATADLRFTSIILSLLAICLIGAFVWSVAPTIQYDALNYHLAVPAIYVQRHATVELPEEFRSYWAHNTEMLYTLALLLAGQPLPAFIHLGFGLFTAGLVYTLGRRLAGQRTGMVAALLFVSVPLVTFEAGIAYVDLVITFYAFASVYAVALWWLEADDNWLTVAGVLAGLGLGTKLNMALELVPLGLIVAFGVMLRYRLSLRGLLALLRFGLPALLLFAPWLLRDWLWTGNPVFPYFNAIFKSTKWPLENNAFAFANSFGLGHGVVDFVRLPWDLTLHATAFAEITPPGAMGALSMLALPWLYWGWTGHLRRLALSGLAFTVGVIIFWFLTGPYVRFLLPLYPVLAVLAALNVERLWISLLNPSWRKAVTAIGMSIAFGYVGAAQVIRTEWEWIIPERYPYQVAVGLETPVAFLSRTLPVYDAFQFLNRQNDGNNRVLSIGNEFKLYSFSRIIPITGLTEASKPAISSPLASSLAQMLFSQGYDYMIIDENQVQANPAPYQFPGLNDDFMSHFTRLEFARHQIYVYRLLPGPAQASPEKKLNLLKNNSFEQIDAQGKPTSWFVYGNPIVDRSGTRAHFGQVAVMADGQGGYFQRVIIVPGTLYTLAHWTRADQPSQFARLQINWLDSNSNIVDVSLVWVPVTDVWQWHEMSITAPDNAVQAQVYANVQGESQVWFDDVEFIQGN